MTVPDKHRILRADQLEGREDFLLSREIPDTVPKTAFAPSDVHANFRASEIFVLHDRVNNLVYVPVRNSIPWQGSAVTRTYTGYTLNDVGNFYLNRSSYDILTPYNTVQEKGSTLDESTLITLLTEVHSDSRASFVLLYPLGL